MAMIPVVSEQNSGVGRAASRPVLFGFAVIAGGLAAATVVLWAHYGTAVFYETILAGINACF